MKLTNMAIAKLIALLICFKIRYSNPWLLELSKILKTSRA